MSEKKCLEYLNKNKKKRKKNKRLKFQTLY